jgi:hypothetical protein
LAASDAFHHLAPERTVFSSGPKRYHLNWVAAIVTEMREGRVFYLAWGKLAKAASFE